MRRGGGRAKVPGLSEDSPTILRAADRTMAVELVYTSVDAIEPMEADANALKGVEALYNLTKAAYDAEISRYDATEAKAGRYLTVLGLVIGAFVVKFDDLLWVWSNSALPPWVATLFVSAYGATLFSAVLAFVFSVLAMSIKEVAVIPVGQEIEELFLESDYKVALEMTTESFRSAARTLRETTEERIGYVERTNTLVKFIMVAGTISLLVYIPLLLSARDTVQKHEETTMSDTPKPSSTTTTNTDTSTKPSEIKPATTAKPPAFEWVKRDAGDIIRKK